MPWKKLRYEYIEDSGRRKLTARRGVSYPRLNLFEPPGATNKPYRAIDKCVKNQATHDLPGEGHELKSSPDEFIAFQQTGLTASLFFLLKTPPMSYYDYRLVDLTSYTEIPDRTLIMIKTLITSIALASFATLSFAQEFNDESGTLSVTGTASVSVENTAAMVNFGVKVQSKTSAQAVQQNSDLLSEVYTSMARHGIEPEDIQTSSISLQRVKDTSNTTVVGYLMSNSVSVHVNNIATLDEVLGAATDAGINEIRSVQMVPGKDTVDEDRLRRLAASDAYEKAKLYADALDLEIVGIQSVSEGSIARPSPMPHHRMLSAKTTSVPIAAGNSERTASVHAVYRVKYSGSEE
jgi:uncharacterized protein